TGRTRRSSSSMGTSAAPGRVLSPPTSTTAAPSAANRRPWATAASGSSQRPPSENESGVTLRTPMTSGRDTAPQATGALAGFRALPCGYWPTASCERTGQLVNELHGLVAGSHAVPELAPDGGRHGERARLPHAPHRHAEVLGLQHDEHAARLQAVVDLVGDLGGEAFLNLGALRERVDEA